MNYFYDYLQYYFSYQLINNGYEKLKIDNKSLMNMTKTLLSIVDDILSSNYEMVTTNNIHANALNFIKTNLIDKQKMNTNLNPINMNNDQMPIIRSQKKELSIKFGNNLNQGVIKVVNKNNLNIMKQNRRRGSIIITETQGENLNDNKINNTENNNIENDNNNNNNNNNEIEDSNLFNENENNFIDDSKNKGIDFNSFEIIELLHTGNFGKIYKVYYKNDKKYYLMKIYNKEYLIRINKLKDIISLYNNILREIKFTFICNLYYSFQNEENLFIIIDFCLGENLDYYLKLNLF